MDGSGGFLATLPVTNRWPIISHNPEIREDSMQSSDVQVHDQRPLDARVNYIKDQCDQALSLCDTASVGVGALEACLDEIDSRIQALERSTVLNPVQATKHKSRIPRELSVSASTRSTCNLCKKYIVISQFPEACDFNSIHPT